MVLCVCSGKGDKSEMLALGCYNLNRQTNLAEVAFLVRDEWQKKGIGTALLKTLIEAAKARGIQGFVADVMADNQPMLRVFHNAPLAIESRLEDGIFSLTMRFEDS